MQWETIAHEAHQLKGASANVGAEGIRALAQQIEELARAQTQPTQVQALIQEVATALAQVAPELEYNG
jgi:HPt (histidine-containing phosphotransfer) domain-containing protein